MKFEYKSQQFDIPYRSTQGFAKVTRLALPWRSAERFITECARRCASPSDAVFLGKSQVRGYAGSDEYWHFEIKGEAFKIHHAPDLSVKRRIQRGRGF